MNSDFPYSLSYSALESLVDQPNFPHKLIPIYRSFPADFETPLSTFIKIAGENTNSFLLESIEGGEWQNRYSFIGTEPYKTLRQSNCDPLIEIQRELEKYSTMDIPGMPELMGGGIGYIGYDCIHYFEPTVPMAGNKMNNNNNNENNNNSKFPQLSIPDSIFLFCRSLIIFDHIKHSIIIISHILLENQNNNENNENNNDNNNQNNNNKEFLLNSYNNAIEEIDKNYKKLLKPLPMEYFNYTRDFNGNGNKNSNSSDTDTDTDSAVIDATGDEVYSFLSSPLVSNVGQSGYESFVSALKENILAGDIIQAVPSQRCAKSMVYSTSFDIYRELRVVNPSPYMFYLRLDDLSIVGASPERLVKVDKNRRVTTHPIAGTRKRGRTEEEDKQLERELLASEKEQAEHIMLVDLGRNDLGRICSPGTVKVDSLMNIERYSHVMHIVSHVSGILSPERSIFDALRSTFPAGTVSGAPKIRAMQLIAGLEKERRGVYGGAVGFISFTGVLEVAIALRTLFTQNSVAYLQAGGGIVFDSNPTDEWFETVNKMKATAVAVERAEINAWKRKIHQRKLFNEEKINNNNNNNNNSSLHELNNIIANSIKKYGFTQKQMESAVQSVFNNHSNKK